MDESSGFVPFHPPKIAGAERGDDFVPASYTSRSQFVSLFGQLDHEGAGGEPQADFIPDLGIDLEEDAAAGPTSQAALDAARAEGREEAAAAAQEVIDALKQELDEARRGRELTEGLYDGVETLRRQALAQAAQDLTDLALAMTRRVVEDSMAFEPAALLGIVKRALDRLPGEDVVTIRVRPEDLSLLESRLRPRRAVKLVTDPDLHGGCILEADFGTVDASLEAAMEGLTEAVQSWRMEHQL